MRTNVRVKCLHCNREWDIRPDHALKGVKCSRCGGNEHKTNELFLTQLKRINNKIETLTEYSNAKTKILCKCSFCGHEWYAIPNKLIEGNGCPECDKRNKTSFAEQAIYYYLKERLADVCNRFTLESEENKRMEIDIYIKSLSLGIEYDGIYWHKNKQALEDKKYKLCKENGIRLIRIREGKDQPDTACADYVIKRLPPYSCKSLDDAIKELVAFIDLDIDIDTCKDANNIRRYLRADGEERKASLRKMGYDPDAVQKIVNRILK